MCRIAGISNPNLSSQELISSIKLMCDAQQHGGPDGEGSYISEENHIALGHRRLALLDLSEAGKQPMAFDEGRFHITYNGEIYNYPELKKELQKLGYVFHTVCDTEMILVAFKEWGQDCFIRFKGMFAIALFDRVKKELFLVRDPSGIKPLYYYKKDKQLYFSSEVRALMVFPFLNFKEPKASILLLAYGHLPEPLTSLKDVLMLPKGSLLKFELDSGKSTISIFKKYNFEEVINDRKLAIQSINEKLDTSVHEHLLSDAPIGVFLSGGIDSSLIALLAHKYTGERLKTLSLFFKEQLYSEKEFQDIIIKQTHCDHAQYLLTGGEFSKHFEEVIDSMDCPSTDGLNTWFISKYAKQFGLKAVLSGVGSDELFGGYPSFKRINLAKILKKFPKRVIKLLSRAGGKYSKIEYLNLEGASGEYLFLRGIYIPKEIAKILLITEQEVWKILATCPIVEDIEDLSNQNQASWIELNFYMQNQLLRDSDVMSMTHGIEIRVPFLDDALVSEAMKISSNVKYGDLLPKQILIDSFKNMLPEPIWNRNKMGFKFPFAEWLKDNLFVDKIMNSNKEYQKVYTKFKAGKLSWAHVMAIIVLQKKLHA